MIKIQIFKYSKYLLKYDEQLLLLRNPGNSVTFLCQRNSKARFLLYRFALREAQHDLRSSTKFTEKGSFCGVLNMCGS